MGRLNPWLQEKLSRVNSPPTVNLIIEAEDPSQVNQVRGELARVSGLNLGAQAFSMSRAIVPLALVPQVSAIPGVLVHYDMPIGIRMSAPSITDPLLGTFHLSSVEIPFTPQEMALKFAPNFALGIATFPFRMLNRLTGSQVGPGNIKQPDVIIYTTGQVRALTGAPDDNKMTHTKVAVLDTGLSYPHPLFHPTKGIIKLGTFAGPVPFDALGHGQWCSTAAFGDSASTRFGLCRGIADPEGGTLGSWKVLSDIGFGTNFSIIQGIEAAYKWGAKVISMSLGGPLQGDVDSDPMCRIVKSLKDEIIFVVAAGNSGPSEWTIGSPGASPHVLTVGAYSPHYGGIAIFSSRGPNGEWYVGHGGRSHEDFSAHGEDMIKPDVIAPGGGPVEEGQPMDLIHSGVVGWTDGMYDLTPLDLFGPMRGTSMACPIAAGLVALAVERGMLTNIKDVKRLMRNSTSGGKNNASGYGMITWQRLGG